MEDVVFLRDLILVLGTAFLGGFLAKKFHQPLLSGYILSGILGGFFFQFLHFKGYLENFAEIGVALLMFTLGIEFSWLKLKRIGLAALLGVIVQIIAVILFLILILPIFGFDFYSSLFLGACFSLSSTAVVIKILSDRGELDTLPGELTTGWLLIQDLAVLPMIILLPFFSKNLQAEENFFFSLVIFLKTILKAIILYSLLIITGKKLIPSITNWILKIHSRELLLLAVFSFCLVFSFFASYLGLSFALGAFLAGFLISEIGITSSIFAEIRPLRDIFAIVFFVSLGFLINPQFLIVNFLKIFTLSFLVVILKFLVVFSLVLYLGFHTKTAFYTSVSLISVGEFAAVLGQMGVKQNLISQEVSFFIVSVLLLTIILTPWTIGLAPIFYHKIKTLSHRSPVLLRFFTKFDRKPVMEELPFENHIVILGFGRVGKYIGRALELTKIPFLVVDYNPKIIKQLKEKGIAAVYGDPSEIDVLDFAQVDKAKMVIIAIPDRQTQEMVIANIKTLNKEAKIICRTHHEEDQAFLRAFGVETIVQPEFEAALSIVNKVLSDYGLIKEEIEGKIKRLKIEHGIN